MKKNAHASMVALVVAAVGISFLIAAPSLAVEAAYPVEHAAHAAKSGLLERLKGAWLGATLSAENRRLKREVDSLKMYRGDCERLERENARLRRALDYISHSPEEWLSAAVLSEGGGTAAAHDVVRVDKGSLAGVEEGAVVAVPGGLVGRVGRVTAHTAEVTLLTDPTMKVSCEIEGVGGALGVISGGEGDVLAIRHLRRADALPPRSRVLTSGRGGVFPAGIEVGTLLFVTNLVRSVEGEVLPSVDFSSLEDVFIRREK